MKLKSKKVLKSVPLLVFSMMIIFASCGGGNQKDENNKQLQEAKQKTIKNLNQFKLDIEERIAYVDEEIEKADGEVEEKLIEAKSVLQEQRDLLQSQLDAVQDAGIDNWNDVVANATESYGKARQKTNEVSKEVSEMLDEEE
ncbi:MAG: hypothetical protein ACLFQS_07570 [Bacteroidales bacterium]